MHLYITCKCNVLIFVVDYLKHLFHQRIKTRQSRSLKQCVFVYYLYRDAIGMLRIISERTLQIDEDLCVCFIDWKQAFDRVNWNKLMQTLKGIDTDWRE